MIDSNPGNYSFDTAVVVIGGGGCGLAAALAAAQGGAEVLLLEKMPRPWSNTARSGGMIPAAGTRLQQAAGVVETAVHFAEDIWHKNGHTSDPDLTLHLAAVSKTLVEWLVDDVGVNLVFIDDFKYPGHTQFRMHAPPNRTGGALVADMRRAAENHPHIEIVTDAPAVGLIADGDAVVGVIVQHGAQTERIQCQKVILANNGFAGNPEMVRQYCPAMADALYFGGEGNTGEGILWGMELGAAVAFMDAYQAHANVATPHGILITYAVIMEGGVHVNRHGQRFADESTGYSEHALAVLQQPEGVAWAIYDERIHQLALSFDDYREALAAGAVHTAVSLPDLAAQLNIAAAGLADSVASYQQATRGEVGDLYGRSDCRSLTPPYYGVKVTGALFHTQGGLKVDRNGRVCKPDGAFVPNLYAGGGAAAGISGHGPGGYLSGNGLLTALGLGMLAGQHAAQSIKAREIGD